MSYQAVKTGHRFAGMFIDYMIVFIGLGFVAILSLVVMDFNDLVTGSDYNKAETVTKWAIIIVFAIWTAKDVFGARSLAKRAIKQQILHHKTEAAADPFVTLLRNLLSFIWPVEFCWALINPERRLGDLVAGTKLVSYQGSSPAPSGELWRSFAALGVSLLFWFLLINPIFPKYGEGRGSAVAPQIESLNETKSQKLTDALAFKMGQAFPEIEAKVYDSSNEAGEGFIEVDLFREAEKNIGLSRLYNFRIMIHEISDQTLPETKDWAGRMKVTQKNPLGSSTQELFW
ncbi:MAG: RDD family protein [Bacteroidota bacterium]